MGLLVDGVWRDEWYDTESTGGRFLRPASRFPSWVTPDGSAGPTGAPHDRGRFGPLGKA